MGVASLVLGIFSIILSFLFPIPAAIMGIIGIILGALGKKSNASCATGGLVCSIIGTSLAVLMYIACLACVSRVESIFG